MIAALALAVVLQVGAPEAPESCAPPTDLRERDDALAAYTEGRDLLQQERWAEAAAPLQAALTLDQVAPLAHYGLGQAYMGLRRYSDAAREFAACRATFACLTALPESQRADVLRRLEEEIRKLTDASRELDREGRIRGNTAFPDTGRRIGPTGGDKALVAARIAEALAAAQTWKRRLERREGAPPEVTVALGTALFRSGLLADAEREYEAALAADPSHGDAHYNLAVVYLATDRIAEAEREVKLAQKAGVQIAPRLEGELRRKKNKQPSP